MKVRVDNTKIFHINKTMLTLLLTSMLIIWSTAKIYFKEDFEDGDEWEDRWIESKSRNKEGKIQQLRIYLECF